MESEKPKSIMRRTAIGTTSVAAEAMVSAISASPIPTTMGQGVRRKRFQGAERDADLLLPTSAADDIAQAAPEQFAGYGPFPPKSGGREPGFDEPPCLRQRAASVIGAPTKRAAGHPVGSLLFFETVTMKSNIHPNYHMINGHDQWRRIHDPLDIRRGGATLNLDIDPNTHPAWTGGSQQLLDRGGHCRASTPASAVWASAARSDRALIPRRNCERF